MQRLFCISITVNWSLNKSDYVGDFLRKVPHAPSKTFKQLICIKFAGKRLQYKVLRRAAPPLQEKDVKNERAHV